MLEGSLYIMQNPVFPPNVLKIGRTERNARERAKELFTTGLPDPFDICYEREVPDCVLAEKLVHQSLKKHRHRDNREFFIIPLQQAISTIEEIIYTEFEKNVPTIHAGIHKLEAGTTFRWTCHTKGIVLLFRYEHWLSEEPTIENFWGCKDRDHVLLTTRLKTDLPELVKLAHDHYAVGSLSEIMNVFPGDRIVVISSPQSKLNSQQLSLFGSDLSIVSIIDCRERAKMLGFMESIERHPDGFPIPFGDHFDKKPPSIVHQAFRQVREMGFPDIYCDSTCNSFM